MTTLTLRHTEWHLLGGLLTLMVLSLVASAFFRSLSGIEIFILCLNAFMAGFSFCRGASWERLDEKGICIKRPFSKRVCPWADVISVQIVPMKNGKGRKVGKLQITLPGRSWPLYLAYTKGSLTAVTAWYGPPDADAWGQPPEQF